MADIDPFGPTSACTQEGRQGFHASIEHAVRLQAKAERLRELAEQSVATAIDLKSHVDSDALLAAWEELREAGVRGRKPLFDEVHQRRRRERPLHVAGTVVRRQRVSWEPWPAAMAWVYLLLDEQADVIYVGKTVNPKGRLRDHSDRGVPWVEVELVACDSEAEALRIEGDLIFQHQPPWNIADRGRRRRVS